MSAHTQKIVKRFAQLMRLNYEAIGFKLLEVRALARSHGTVVTWCLRCPCGTKESAAICVTDEAIENIQFDLCEHVARQLAHNGLTVTASREHIEDDVARGVLPQSALDSGKFFSGNLLT